MATDIAATVRVGKKHLNNFLKFFQCFLPAVSMYHLNCLYAEKDAIGTTVERSVASKVAIKNYRW
jgi:hypothetical protein